jgi:hypothetical protein
MDTGNVGIGLTNPNTKLQVSGSATIGGYNAFYSGTGVTSLSITAPLYPVLAFYYGTTLAGTVGGYSDHVSIYAAASKYISFDPGDSEKMRIKADGNVGIGTTSPVTQLHVSGSLQIGNGTNYGNKFTLYDDFSSGKLAYVMRDLNSDDIFGLYCNSTTGEVRFLADDDDANTAFMTFQTNASERMRITSSGNVGIGTTNPAYKLQIYGVQNANDFVITNATTGISLRSQSNDASAYIYTTGNLPLGFGTNNTVNQLIIATTGNVGIGTTSPSYKLDVNGNIGFSGDLRFASANTIYNASGDFYLRSAGILNLGSGGSNSNVVITSAGNVGIGTASPSKLLHVNGEATFATNSGGLIIRSYDGDTANIRPSVGNGSILISDDSGLTTRGTEFLNNGGIIVNATSGAPLTVNANGTIGLYVNSTANVGIGNTSPSTLLDVSGVITATG